MFGSCIDQRSLQQIIDDLLRGSNMNTASTHALPRSTGESNAALRDRLTSADNEAPCRQDPIAAYAEFLVAIQQRNVDSVLARLAESYGSGLRRVRSHKRFDELFGLWCDGFPQHIATCACSFDTDTAILQTNNRADAQIVQAWVKLVLRRGEWLVSSERCDNGCTRIPTCSAALIA